MFQVFKLKRGPKLEPIGTRHILHSNKLSKFHISHAVCEIFSFRHQIQKYMSKKSQDQSQLSHLRDEKKDQRICLACYKSIRTGKLQPLATKGNNLKTISIPVGLKDLNTLEQFLLPPVILFMKIICLPK